MIGRRQRAEEFSVLSSKLLQAVQLYLLLSPLGFQLKPVLALPRRLVACSLQLYLYLLSAVFAPPLGGWGVGKKKAG